MSDSVIIKSDAYTKLSKECLVEELLLDIENIFNYGQDIDRIREQCQHVVDTINEWQNEQKTP